MSITMSERLAIRWLYRYKFFFLLGFVILVIQVFLAYKSLGIVELNLYGSAYSSMGHDTKQQLPHASNNNSNYNSVADDEVLIGINQITSKLDSGNNQNRGSSATAGVSYHGNRFTFEQLGFQLDCEIKAKEAISALQRSKTIDCKKHIAQVACSIQTGHFYAAQLPSYCPAGNFTANKSLGCYRDEKEYRLLSGYFTNFKVNNSPKRCIQLCLQSGYPYAGVQYGTECFCGTEPPPTSVKLPDSSCNMKCPGDSREICGGYLSMNIYKTGIAKFTAKIANTNTNTNVKPVRIAFILTLNGRALRQVHRLIKALYAPTHMFYIHVDSRSDYLHSNLLLLEEKFPNIRLARKRFSTIWGGASLLTMLLQCMTDLLNSSQHWDFVINLSESDFPVKTIDKLVNFLTANKNGNFVKSHGRETQRFIQKQGLDKTFVECDTHMWRIGDRVLPHGIQVDGGSDWIALSRPFVEFVTNHEQNELLRGLLTIFHHTLLPAESFFHTVLRNSEFCDTYIDNNLHLTNWKRKLGCKCQYRHVVDWCGCSPNVFKTEDFNRLQDTEPKMLFFARKFEPVINQKIILKLEEWLIGPYTKEYENLNSYWQSLYHRDDKFTAANDLTLTIAHSLLRINGKKFNITSCQLHEISHFMSNDQYKGFVLRYQANFTDNRTMEFETRVKPKTIYYDRVVKTARLAKRIRNFEVSSDFDQKEQLSRNFAKFLGPRTDLVLSFTFLGVSHSDSHSYNLTILWIDPRGNLQDFNEIHIEDNQSNAINSSKANLKYPITPGIWTVKLIGRTSLVAYTKFLVSPLTFEGGKPIRLEKSRIINLGSSHTDLIYPSEWQQHLPQSEDVKVLTKLVQANANRSGISLLNWVDELVNKFFLIRETCYIFGSNHLMLNECKDTMWSSLAPDPKSDIYTLLDRS